MIATGELTGRLDESFQQTATQLEKSLTLQKRIKKALRYPLFLVLVSGVVILVMLLVVLPKFAQVYAGFGAILPAFTQQLIAASNFLMQHGLVMLFMASTLMVIYHYRLKSRYQPMLDRVLLATPLIGRVLKASCLTQIFQTLAITQQAGIPLLVGLSAARKITSNGLYQSAITTISQQIEQGNAFSDALNSNLSPHGGAKALFPSICFQLILAGEESGSLELMFAKLASYFQEQHDELTDSLAKQIEPMVMTLLSLIIGGFIIAIYLPIFQLGEVIN